MIRKILGLKRYLNLRDFFEFLRGLIKNRKLIIQMVKKDFRNQYLGSFLGIFWAFFQPAVYILVLWFVFALGFRKGRAGEFPFLLYLMSGMIVWSYFSEGLSTGAKSILESKYLVKKMVFRLSILPVVKILSALFVHFIFIGLFFCVNFAHGFWPDIYVIQLIYYMFAAFILLLGVTWISSALNVFIKDTGQIISVLVKIGFWFTPIFWEISMFPQRVQFILKLNPVYYLVNGYRESLFYKTWFWEHPRLFVYFWIFTLLTFAIGAVVFRRLKPHFADVL